jgi:hypothetical protein
MKRLTPVLAVCVVSAGVCAFPAAADRAPPDLAYRTAPLVEMGWPPPAQYRPFIWPGHCMDLRLPDRQERYCPPKLGSDG